MEPLRINISPRYTNESKLGVVRFFGTNKNQYYLSIDSDNVTYKDEGFAYIKGTNIYFEDNNSKPKYNIDINDLIVSNIKGMNMDEIQMVFKNNIAITAER